MSLLRKIDENQESNQLDLQNMADIVYHALMHLHLVSKHTPIDESFAKYPIVEYLERQLHCPKIALEHSFGDIFPTDRRIDLYFEDTDNKEGTNKKYAIEFKYISERSSNSNELQRIFNDTMRMSLALSDLHYDRTFVLLFGETKNFLPLLCGEATIDKSGSIAQVKNGARIGEIADAKLSWLSPFANEEVVVSNTTLEKMTQKFGNTYFAVKRKKKNNNSRTDIVSRIQKGEISYKTILKTSPIKSKTGIEDCSYPPPFMVAIWEIVND